MSTWYGTKLPVEEVMVEQSEKWPKGPLIVVTAPVVHGEITIPGELVQLWEDLKAGKITDLEAAQALGKFRTKVAAPGLLTPLSRRYSHGWAGQS